MGKVVRLCYAGIILYLYCHEQTIIGKIHHLAVLNDDNLCSSLLLQRLNRLATLADDSRHQVPRHLAHQDEQLQTMYNSALYSPSFHSLRRRSHPPLDHHRHHLEGLHGIPVQEYG